VMKVEFAPRQELDCGGDCFCNEDITRTDPSAAPMLRAAAMRFPRWKTGKYAAAWASRC